MKKSAIILLMCLIFNFVNAQDETHAFRFSQTTIGGTAKFVALGGACSATGADFSAISVNPAGIAVNKKSEITFTPSLYVKTADATYLNNQRHDADFNFNINNFGFVTTVKTENSKSGWVNFNFGIGYKKLNKYNSNITIEGVNTKSSLLDQYLDEANGTHYLNLDEYGALLPFNTYLLNFANGYPDSSHYVSVIEHYGEAQRKTIATKGSSGETVFSFGANYKDKFYIGMAINIPNIRYTYNSNYSENDHKDTIPDFKSFNLKEYYSTSGSGFNCKFGIIYKPANFLRLGAAIHSPTIYSMGIDYNKEMSSSFDSANAIHPSGNMFSDKAPDGSFNYKIITPMRAIGSVGFVFGKKGLINIEYEYVDYSKAILRSDDYDFNEENKAINKKYTSPNIIRAGGELNFSPYVIRAGYAFYGNPYKGDYNKVYTYIYSIGFGYRVENFFLDFAYSLSNYNEKYYMYNTTRIETEPAKIEYNNSNFLITIGIRY
ncbi:MAG: hypothetical protein WC223_12820 [Bacteroidales bacterium]|jgi:hypothetical protein